jgi:hypothetical protein
MLEEYREILNLGFVSGNIFLTYLNFKMFVRRTFLYVQVGQLHVIAHVTSEPDVNF